MVNNLGMPIGEFQRTWEKDYLGYEGTCPHIDQQYKEGWIPLAHASYSPALKRFNEESSPLAKEIVKVLETPGQFIFKDRCFMGDLDVALEEIMFNIPPDIAAIIADNRSDLLMIDRQAYSIDGELCDVDVQWYIKRPQTL